MSSGENGRELASPSWDPEWGEPVKLERVTPSGPIRIIFWGLRIYIVVMVVVVVIGFTRGLH
jgi:hypothetical protein